MVVIEQAEEFLLHKDFNTSLAAGLELKPVEFNTSVTPMSFRSKPVNQKETNVNSSNSAFFVHCENRE